MAVRRDSRRGHRIRAGGSSLLGMGLLSLAVLLGAWILSSRSQPESPQPISQAIVAEFDTIEVPVPRYPVAAGTKVSEIELQMVSFPRHQLPPGALTSLVAIQEAVTVAPLPANLPLFKANFSLTAHRSNPVIERIPEGMRAITVRVDATAAVEGWAGSGSVVDVLLAEKDTAVVVAERVRVLSAERDVSPVEGSGAPSIPSTVTLLVSQEQALAINTAVGRGRLSFALRSQQDEKSWSQRVYSADRLKGRSSARDARANVAGFIAVKDEKGQQGYALTNGAWVKTDVVPEGFLIRGIGGFEKNAEN